MRRKRGHGNTLAAWIAGIFVFGADFFSKAAVHAFLPLMQRASPWYPYGGIPLFRDFLGIEFSITHATNTGAAWGVLGGYQVPLLIVRILLIVCLAVYTALFAEQRRKLPFALILSGAAANVADYFLYGHVVDMFHFVFWGYSYPVFNIADSSIFIGVLWLIATHFQSNAKTAESCQD